MPIQPSRKLVLRCDAGYEVGMGHVMRNIAFAEVASGFALRPVFVVTEYEPALNAIRTRGFDWLTVTDNSSPWLEHVSAHDVVLYDGYAFGDTDFAAAKARSAIVVAIDDFSRIDAVVDIVVQTDVIASTSEVEPLALQGPRFLPIRQEFADRQWDSNTAYNTALVTLGGTDPRQLLSHVVQTALEFNAVTALVGAGSTLPKLDDRVRLVQDPVSVVDTLIECDFAVSAAGMTSWELLSMGVPTIALITHDNQRAAGATMKQHQAAYVIDARNETAFVPELTEALKTLGSLARRTELSRRGRELVDTNGAKRVLEAISALA